MHNEILGTFDHYHGQILSISCWLDAKAIALPHVQCGGDFRSTAEHYYLQIMSISGWLDTRAFVMSHIYCVENF